MENTSTIVSFLNIFLFCSVFSDAVCILKCLKSIRRHTCIYVQYLSVTNEVLSDPDAQMCREEKQHWTEDCRGAL